MGLERDFQYFIDHQEELVRAYNGRVVALQDGRVLGVYGTELEAALETSKTHELGTFLVQRCEPGPEAYTGVYHSPLVF
jgi:hypothetical protein